MTSSPWHVVYFDTPDLADSAVAFLDACPHSVEAHLKAVLDAVAVAPPPRFSGGGYWEAMHGEMRVLRGTEAGTKTGTIPAFLHP